MVGSAPSIQRRAQQRGFTYLALLFAIALHGAVLAAAGSVWSTAEKRERERELLFVGDQFRSAIAAYARGGPGIQGQLPRTLDDLLLDPRFPVNTRHLRRIFVDPITWKAEWGLVRTPDGNAIVGVYSLSDQAPLKKAHFEPADRAFEGAARYSDWKFVYKPQ